MACIFKSCLFIQKPYLSRLLVASPLPRYADVPRAVLCIHLYFSGLSPRAPEQTQTNKYFNRQRFEPRSHFVSRLNMIVQVIFVLLLLLTVTDVLACVAGARKGRGRELGRETTREAGGRRKKANFLPRARQKNSPFPFQRLPRRLLTFRKPVR